MDVIVVLEGTPLDEAALTAEFLLGDYLQDERVVFRRAQRLRVQSRPAMRYQVDGETLDGDPVEFSVLPKALQVIVGPEYAAAPDAAPS